MHTRLRYFWMALLVLIIVVDPLVYIRLRHLLQAGHWLYPVIYWMVPVLLMCWFLLLLRFHSFHAKNPAVQKKYFNFFGAFILFYLPKLLFMLAVLVEELINMLIDQVSMYDIEVQFITSFSGMLAAALFLLIFYGMLYGRFHFKKENVLLRHEQLPEVFDGLRIAHISDLHIGSWEGHPKKLQRAVDMINRQKPDLIVFTGDLFNNYYEEISQFRGILKQLEASLGKFAVLGNHDYGDYFHWSTRDDYLANFQSVQSTYRELGFHLLLNDGTTLSRGNKRIGLAGVENWGLPPFHQHGDLNRALSQLNGADFTILLSHDPSHWRQQVLKTDRVELTLSGHTHAMQFGIYTPWFKWSPAKIKYPEWGGLYKEGDQYLYVNKGLGYIGFPGRVGIRPEITLITLEQKKGDR